MKRIIFAAAVLAALVLGSAIAKDPAARDRLGRMWAEATALVTGRAPAQPQNWGDVAHKIGEFAKEERGLTEILSRPVAPEAPAAVAP
jgi:hypothetical protein